MKKIIALLLIIAVAASFGACKKEAASPSPASQTPLSSAGAQPEGSLPAQQNPDVPDDGGSGTSKPVQTGLITATIAMESTRVKAGKEFTAKVTFSELPQGSDAWIGIVPSSIPHGEEGKNDENDIQYLYLSDLMNGIAGFTAPETPGAYDLRVFDSDNSDIGVEVAYISFIIE